MATLIAVYNSEGLVGRCDARCYNAATPACDCICGGRNHGAGRDKAEQNIRELAEQMIEEYAGRTGLEDYKAEVPARRPQQLGLFGE